MIHLARPSLVKLWQCLVRICYGEMPEKTVGRLVRVIGQALSENQPSVNLIHHVCLAMTAFDLKTRESVLRDILSAGRHV